MKIISFEYKELEAKLKEAAAANTAHEAYEILNTCLKVSLEMAIECTAVEYKRKTST